MFRTLKLIGIGIVVVVLIGLGWLFLSTERPDVYRHSISSTIRDGAAGWGEFVPLIPGEFELNEPGDMARGKLFRAGYKQIPNDKVWARYASIIEDGKVIYSREADNFICAIRLRVFIEFNAEDRVVFAEGNIQEHGCM